MRVDNKKVIEDVLDDYIARILPALYRQRYHLRLAKGGPDYPHLPEQSLLVHILNGVFGLTRLLCWLVDARIHPRGLDETMFRRVLALYTIHDLHKFGGDERLGESEFSIPLDRLRAEWDALGLAELAGEVDEHLMRAANVSRRSRHQGDLLLAGDDASRAWLLVRIADGMASAINPPEAASSLAGYLKALVPEVAMGWRLYWHELRDVRGVLTNLVHNAVASRLTSLDFYPLLYFPTGTLYVGPKALEGFERTPFVATLADDVLRRMVPPQEFQKSAAAEGLRRKEYDFQRHVYLFADVPVLMEIVWEETQRTKPDPRVVPGDIAQIGEKKSAPPGWAGSFEARFAVSLKESREFLGRWSLVRRYLLYVDTLFKALAPEVDRIGWYAETFRLPPAVTNALREDQRLFESGGDGKHVIIPAYYFLKGEDFVARPAEATDVPKVLELLHRRVLAALARVDIPSGRQAVVGELGFHSDLKAYLEENLVFSWAPQVRLTEDALQDYAARKRKGHSSRLCSLCNRTSEHVQALRTNILGDFGRVFSNRVLPALEAPGGNRPWCPVCHMEFILRQLAGLGLPAGADYGTSYRIYLFVLPTYSFTPEYAGLLSRLMRPLRQVTALPVRDYGEASPGLPRLWLDRRELDPDWVDTAVGVFEREAARIASHPGFVGDRLITTGVFPQPNYFLVPWERSVRQGERDDARIPTRTEAWAKATFAAVVIASLTGSRVYVTERPFLPLSDPDALKSTVTLDSPPPAIAKLLGNERDSKLKHLPEGVSLYGGENGRRSGLERALDLCAAVWQVTCDVHAPGAAMKDKRVADRLGLIMLQPLSGACFYKEYSRLNDGASPFPPLARACEVLLEHLGGEWMDLVTRIAEKALEIRLPYREIGRGKIHSYELVFREAVGAVREEFVKIPELRRLALIGQPPSSESLAGLKKRAAGRLYKAMERRRDAKKYQNIINPWGGDLNAVVGELIDLIVDGVFLGQAGGSFTRFSQAENGLADGVYYYIDRVLPQKWEAYGRLRAERQAEAAAGV